MKDFYDLLGVASTAAPEEIRDAWRVRSALLHPDRCDRDRQAKQWEHANRMFGELREAYDVLGDPRRRRRYDALRAETAGHQHSAQGSAFAKPMSVASSDRGSASARASAAWGTQATTSRSEVPPAARDTQHRSSETAAQAAANASATAASGIKLGDFPWWTCLALPAGAVLLAMSWSSVDGSASEAVDVLVGALGLVAGLALVAVSAGRLLYGTPASAARSRAVMQDRRKSRIGRVPQSLRGYDRRRPEKNTPALELDAYC